jgi:hypothetical protein
VLLCCLKKSHPKCHCFFRSPDDWWVLL